MSEPTYSVKVEIEGKDGFTTFDNVLYDGTHPDKPYFYMFRFLDHTQKEFPIGRILYLEYGKDKSDCIEYWRRQEQK